MSLMIMIVLTFFMYIIIIVCFASCIDSEASKYLIEVLSEVHKRDLDKWIQKIIEIVQKQPCK